MQIFSYKMITFSTLKILVLIFCSNNHEMSFKAKIARHFLGKITLSSTGRKKNDKRKNFPVE